MIGLACSSLALSLLALFWAVDGYIDSGRRLRKLEREIEKLNVLLKTRLDETPRHGVEGDKGE